MMSGLMEAEFASCSPAAVLCKFPLPSHLPGHCQDKARMPIYFRSWLRSMPDVRLNN